MYVPASQACGGQRTLGGVFLPRHCPSWGFLVVVVVLKQSVCMLPAVMEYLVFLRQGLSLA